MEGIQEITLWDILLGRAERILLHNYYHERILESIRRSEPLFTMLHEKIKYSKQKRSNKRHAKA